MTAEDSSFLMRKEMCILQKAGAERLAAPRQESARVKVRPELVSAVSPSQGSTSPSATAGALLSVLCSTSYIHGKIHGAAQRRCNGLH